MIDAFVVAAGLARVAHEGPAEILRAAQEARLANVAAVEAPAHTRPADRVPGGILAADGPPKIPLAPPNPNAPPSAGPGPQYLVNFSIEVFLGKGKTGTNYFERFQAHVPLVSDPRPLLVAYHRWGVSHLDIDINTPLFDLARQNDWYIIAPLSASGVHVHSLEGQQNTAVAIDWMIENFNIDPERIYGLGFSMGGGMTMNFAARQLDPKRFMFAAVVDHTGAVSQNHTYANANGGQFVWEHWFGPAGQGSPPDPFQMLRTSVIDFDPQTLVVDTNTDMARNLGHIQVMVSRADNEAPATAYLTTQCDVLVDHLASMGTIPYEEIVPFTGHSWDSLNFAQAFFFLSQWTLRLPENADTLADQDGNYYYFYIQQDAPGAFTPFSWSINLGLNKVLIYKSKNLKQVDVDLPLTGLATDQTLWVVLQSGDGAEDDVLLKGWPAAPSDVTRDGVSQIGLGTFTYDPAKQELFIDESDPAIHQWHIIP